ncbi:MAG: DUF2934 domain-containing protein [Phycisphaerales bacterium]
MSDRKAKHHRDESQSSNTTIGTGPATKGQATPPTRDQIERRAYQIFAARNGEAGDALLDWIQAERELGAGVDPRPSEAGDPPVVETRVRAPGVIA